MRANEQPFLAAAPSTPTPQILTIDVSTAATLYGRVWCASRTIVTVLIMIFLTLYFFSVVASDYELAAGISLAQPILLVCLLSCWMAIGNIRRSIGVHLCVLHAICALASVALLVQATLSIPLIEEYSRRFPDQQWDRMWRGILGPHGPSLFFLGLFGLLVCLLVPGAIAAIALRFKKMRGMPATIVQLDEAAKKLTLWTQDSLAMRRQVNQYRWQGAAFATLAFLSFLMPSLLPGREASIPSPGDELQHQIPDFLARLFVFFTDRWYGFLIALPFAFLFLRRARRYFSPDARQVMANKELSPPVLLLRAFADDLAAVPSTAFWRKLLIIKSLRRRRVEEIAATSLSPLGPFIAVSNPGEKVPQLGALRADLKDDEWKDHVLKWIRQSRLIVMIAGTSEGVIWELEQVRDTSEAIVRLVLLFPPDGIAQRWSCVLNVLRKTAWHANMIDADLRGVLAVQFLDGGKVAIIRSRARRERDYELALRVASYRLCARTAAST